MWQVSGSVRGPELLPVKRASWDWDSLRAWASGRLYLWVPAGGGGMGWWACHPTVTWNPGALLSFNVFLFCSKLLHLSTLFLLHCCEHEVRTAATGSTGPSHAALCDSGPVCPGTGAG